jgi:hypothetical protein
MKRIFFVLLMVSALFSTIPFAMASNEAKFLMKTEPEIAPANPARDLDYIDVNEISWLGIPDLDRLFGLEGYDLKFLAGGGHRGYGSGSKSTGGKGRYEGFKGSKGEGGDKGVLKDGGGKDIREGPKEAMGNTAIETKGQENTSVIAAEPPTAGRKINRFETPIDIGP